MVVWLSLVVVVCLVVGWLLRLIELMVELIVKLLVDLKLDFRVEWIAS